MDPDVRRDPVSAARLWKPGLGRDDPVPGVLEMIPYRKRDLTAVRDSIHHPYMAGYGYACLRVDLRGSGDSEGVLTDEYLRAGARTTPKRCWPGWPSSPGATDAPP